MARVCVCSLLKQSLCLAARHSCRSTCTTSQLAATTHTVRVHPANTNLLVCCSRVARVLTHRFAIVLQMPQTSFRPCSSRMQSLDVAFSSFVSPLCFLTLSSVMPPCEALRCVRACADTGRVVGTGTPLLASRRMLVCATLSLLPSARWQDAKVTWPLGLR